MLSLRILLILHNLAISSVFPEYVKVYSASYAIVKAFDDTYLNYEIISSTIALNAFYLPSFIRDFLS
jgi:hypothetical protein